MLHFIDFYLKSGVYERVSWSHDPDPFDIQCYAEKHFGGWSNVYTAEAFPVKGPTFQRYFWNGGNWVKTKRKKT